MKISMSKKIFSIIAMLLVLALAIFGLGSYSISLLNSEMASLNRRAKRTVNLNMMDKIVLERQIAMEGLIASNDEKEMEGIFQERIQVQDRLMEEELAKFTDNFSDNLTPEQRERPAAIKRMWEQLNAVYYEAAELARENSNNRADRIATELIPF